jgi:hypothetical protein
MGHPLYADAQILEEISNFSSGIAQTWQLHDLFDDASISTNAFAIGIIVAFALLTVANVATYCITQKRLNELRQDINYLDNLNRQLNQLYQLIEDTKNSLQQ